MKTSRPLLVALALGALAACGARAWTGDEPAAVATVVHRLPFPAGVGYAIFQGNDQGPTHNDVWNRYAFDFSPMPVGSDVCASADGVVVYVKEDATGPTGRHEDNNEVDVEHADGTVSVYAHLQHDGALVAVGQRVLGGDVIAKSGNTGSSSAPHLHHALRAGRLGECLPLRYADVAGSGVPTTGQFVISANAPLRPIEEAFAWTAGLYDRAAGLDAREVAVPAMKALLAPAPPPDVAAALAALKARPDARARFAALRDALLARYRADGDAALAAIVAARAEDRFAEAVARAQCARVDFAPLPVLARVEAALADLKKDARYGKAYLDFTPRLAWRRELVRALDLDAKARRKTAKRERAGWAALWTTYDGLVRRAPTDDLRAPLEAYVGALRAEFGDAE